MALNFQSHHHVTPVYQFCQAHYFSLNTKFSKYIEQNKLLLKGKRYEEFLIFYTISLWLLQ